MIDKQLELKLTVKDIYNDPTIEKICSGVTEVTDFVRLNTEKPGLKNIYFIPPILGNSILYKSLADTLQDRYNCYGFQYKGVETGEEFVASVEEMAALFSNSISRHQQQERFMIVGYSMGAAIAFEMAKLLEPSFKSIELVLIDRGAEKKPDEMYQHLDKADRHEWMTAELEKFNANQAFDTEHTSRFLLHMMDLLRKYSPTGKIQSNITALEAQDAAIKTNMQGWKNLTAGNVTVDFVEGSHWDAITERNYARYRTVIENVLTR